MNTNTLSRHYDALKPRERLPLILAASERNDESERERLMRSAPRVGYRLPDYYGLANGLAALSLLHAAELLQDLALYHGLSATLCEITYVEGGKEGKARQKRLTDLTRMTAYDFVCKLDAWNLFRTDLKIDSAALLRFLPGYDLVKLWEQLMRTTAFTEAEAQQFVNQMVPAAHRETVALTVATTQSHLERLRATLDAGVQLWA